MIFLALFLALLFAVLVNALWNHARRTAYVVGLYLLLFADIVAVSQAAGLLRLLNNRSFFIAAHLVLALLALVLWLRGGRPALASPFKARTPSQSFLWLKDRAKTYPDLALLASLAFVIYAFGIYLILAVPPNNGDALWHHLTRIGYWLQQGSFLPWNTYSVIAQLTYPINAQALMAWTMLFWGSDQLAGFVQWLTVPVIVCCIYGLGRLLGWRRPQALFAALIWTSFPLVVLESTSAQNHLVASALLAAALFTGYTALQTRKARYFILSGVALGLGMGTFILVIMILPGLALCAGLFLWKYRRALIKPLLLWGVLGILGFILFGAYIYVQNTLIYHNPLGANIVKDNVAFTCVPYAPLTILRHAYSAVDVESGLPPALAAPLVKVKQSIAGVLFSLFNIPIDVPTGCVMDGHFNILYSLGTDENNAYYGLAGTLLLIPGMLLALYRGIQRRDVYRLGILFLPLGIYIYIFSFSWQISFSRYFLLVWTVYAPFMAAFYRPDPQPMRTWLDGLRIEPALAVAATFILAGVVFSGPAPGLLNGILIGLGVIWLALIALCSLDLAAAAKSIALFNFVVIILAVAQMTGSLFLTPSKSLAGMNAIWGRDRIALQTIWYKEFEPGIRMVEKYVPQDATLGLVLEPGKLIEAEFEYPFFGEHLTRRLIHVYPYPQNLRSAWLEENGIDYVLVNYKRRPLPILPQGFTLTAYAGDYYLFEREKR